MAEQHGFIGIVEDYEYQFPPPHKTEASLGGMHFIENRYIITSDVRADNGQWNRFSGVDKGCRDTRCGMIRIFLQAWLACMDF